MMKIGFVSLGCPKNQLDAEVMLHELVTAGYDITADETEADVVIINTCGFIESAKKEAIDNILDIAWLKENRDLKGLVVTGCLAERYRNDILDEFPEVDAVLGVGSIHNIVEAVGKVLEGERYSSFEDKNCVRLGGDRVITTPEFATYLKIAEGCDNRCTYCAIPSIRGKFRSRPMEDIISEARDLERLGCKELTLVAQDTTRYGQDLYGEYKLAALLRRLSEETDIPWFRILYCYPDKITDELIAEMRDNDRICKYIDLPMQHISDGVLKKMNRHGGSAVIRDAVSRLRKEIPDIVIRTTFIVGFPGETDEDFTELCEFVNEQRFEHLGVFTYSREEGTPAYRMEQIDEQIKLDRYDIIMRDQLLINEEYNEKKLGRTLKVLCEGYDPISETYYGRSEADAPEIDGKVYFRGKKGLPAGSFVDVLVEEAIEYDLCGKLVKIY
ncbi:MAG: 30S ribosomal protein S12 methylthiotransferase RimO [Clostridia bacterium]|nr:30S ribosomal protein S12 methylthiotransferase RimO [Clostridia bacterium]